MHLSYFFFERCHSFLIISPYALGFWWRQAVCAPWVVDGRGEEVSPVFHPPAFGTLGEGSRGFQVQSCRDMELAVTENKTTSTDEMQGHRALWTFPLIGGLSRLCSCDGCIFVPCVQAYTSRGSINVDEPPHTGGPSTFLVTMKLQYVF